MKKIYTEAQKIKRREQQKQARLSNPEKYRNIARQTRARKLANIKQPPVIEDKKYDPRDITFTTAPDAVLKAGTNDGLPSISERVKHLRYPHRSTENN